MPKITVPGEKEFEVPSGTRLVLALEENGIDVSHRCGGYAKCTTCRCKIEKGEPSKMTEAEKLKIQEKLDNGDDSVKGVRLSCQILVENDMVVTPLMRVKDATWDDPGRTPEADLTPDPVWVEGE